MHGWLTLRRIAVTAALTLLIALAGTDVARGQEMRDLVEQVLDQRIEDIQIADTPLVEALNELGDKTGLRFSIDERAIDRMPYGAETKISIDLRDVTVRNGLKRTLAGLGMQFRVEGDQVIIECGPVLKRMLRRLEIAELQLLATLASAKWADQPESLRALTGDNTGNLVDIKEVVEAIEKAPGDNALEQLENAAITGNGRWTWLLWGDRVQIWSTAILAASSLNTQVRIDYRDQPLDEVLTDLGERANLRITYEPGVLARIQAERRAVNFRQRETTVRDALDRLCGAAGIEYSLSNDGIKIGLTKTPMSAPPGPSRIIATLRVQLEGGGTLEIPYYADSAPPELLEAVARAKQANLPLIIDALRKQSGE